MTEPHHNTYMGYLGQCRATAVSDTETTEMTQIHLSVNFYTLNNTERPPQEDAVGHMGQCKSTPLRYSEIPKMTQSQLSE